jgi:hypothetical protein
MRILFSFLLFTFHFASTAQIPSYVPTNGLVGWWPFNGNANDESGNGNNLIVNGPTLTTDRNSQVNAAYFFVGQPERAQYLITTSLLPFETQEYSMSIWINTNSYYPPHVSGSPYNYANFSIQGIYQINNSNNWNIAPTRSMALDYNNSIINTGHNTSSTGLGITSNDSLIKINRWYHLVVTYGNSILKLFVNDSLIGSGNIGISYQNMNDMTFGGVRNGTAMEVMGGFNGKIDDIAIYNRALTPQEITQLYTSSVTPSTPEDTTSNVGIGTASPKRKLHVNDVMRLEPRNTAPENPAKGDIYFDGVLNKLRVYDGSVWQSCW